MESFFKVTVTACFWLQLESVKRSEVGETLTISLAQGVSAPKALKTLIVTSAKGRDDKARPYLGHRKGRVREQDAAGLKGNPMK